MTPGSVATAYGTVSSEKRRRPALGCQTDHGERPSQPLREGINWEEPWALPLALGTWRDPVHDKLAPVRMGTSAAGACAIFGAGRSPALILLARGIKEFKTRHSRGSAALHAAGGRNAKVDAPPRPVLQVHV